MKRTFTAVILSGFLAACGGDDDGGPDAAAIDAGGDGGIAVDPAAQVWCDGMLAIQCNLLMDCMTEEERLENGLPLTLEECLEATYDCTTVDPCDPEATDTSFQADAADACIAEYDAATCEEFLSEDFGPGPACMAVCQ